ncbi:hypothetical protein V2J09_003678 [Rumex salicifolius]
MNQLVNWKQLDSVTGLHEVSINPIGVNTALLALHGQLYQRDKYTEFYNYNSVLGLVGFLGLGGSILRDTAAVVIEDPCSSESDKTENSAALAVITLHSTLASLGFSEQDKHSISNKSELASLSVSLSLMMSPPLTGAWIASHANILILFSRLNLLALDPNQVSSIKTDNIRSILFVVITIIFNINRVLIRACTVASKITCKELLLWRLGLCFGLNPLPPDQSTLAIPAGF